MERKPGKTGAPSWFQCPLWELAGLPQLQKVLASALLLSLTAHYASSGFEPVHAHRQSWSVLTPLRSDSQGVLSSARREIPCKT